jgi:hypothetical protein
MFQEAKKTIELKALANVPGASITNNFPDSTRAKKKTRMKKSA